MVYWEGAWQELNSEPVYVFTTQPDDDPARFVLHFNGVSAVDEQVAENHSNGIELFVFANRLTILSTTQEQLNGRVELFSLQGTTVFTAETGNTRLYRKTVDLSPGFYIVRYIGNGEVISRKIRISD